MSVLFIYNLLVFEYKRYMKKKKIKKILGPHFESKDPIEHEGGG